MGFMEQTTPMGCFQNGNPFCLAGGAGDGFAVDAFGFLAKPFDETGGVGDFPKGFRDWFAHFGG